MNWRGIFQLMLWIIAVGVSLTVVYFSFHLLRVLYQKALKVNWGGIARKIFSTANLKRVWRAIFRTLLIAGSLYVLYISIIFVGYLYQKVHEEKEVFRMIFLGVCALMVIIGLLIPYRVYRKSRPKKKPVTPTATGTTPSAPRPSGFKTFWTNYWESGIWLPVIVAILMIDTMVWKIWSGSQEFVLKNLGWVVFLHIVFIVGGSMLPRNPMLKKNMGKLLLTFGTVTTFLLIGANEGWWSGDGKIPTVMARVFARGRTGGSTGPLRESAQGEITTRQFWNGTDLPKDQAEAMIEHARLESGYNQFRPDGLVYRNPNSSAMGKNQILESLWSKDAKEQNLDLATAEGNDLFALWLVKKRVREGKRFDIDWDETSPRKAITVLVPIAPDWSEQINVPVGGSFDIDKGHLLRVLVNKGYPDQRIAEPDKDDPTGYVPLGNSVKNFSIQSRESTSFSLTVRR